LRKLKAIEGSGELLLVTPVPQKRRPVGAAVAALLVLAALGVGAMVFLKTNRATPTVGSPSVAVAPSSEDTHETMIPEADYISMVGKLEGGPRQIAAVNIRMRAFNPGFEGIGPFQTGFWMHEPVPGTINKVRKVDFYSDNVKDITPLKALTQLKRLVCPGSKPGLGKLANLAPLKGFKLIELDVSSTEVADLAPLQGMSDSLTHLSIQNTRVKDLSPLKDLPLVELVCDPPTTQRDLEVLRLLPKLRKINDQKKAEFIKSAAAAIPKKP
jgi:Leucine-rich repeat (LRR) protein